MSIMYIYHNKSQHKRILDFLKAKVSANSKVKILRTLIKIMTRIINQKL